jgi:prepilin-type N-terminal cleavage/methylation domain-containing protein
MMKKLIIKNEKGFSAIELISVVAMIAVLSAFAIPAYNNFNSSSMVREAAVELMQEMKLLRTMAIKEGQSYTILFNTGANSYSIGADPAGNALLVTDLGGYGTMPTKTISLQNRYGGRVIFGSAPITAPSNLPDSCPNCMGTANPVAFGVLNPLAQSFNSDGTIDEPPGYALITHTGNNNTYMVKLSFLTGKLGLWRWDGQTGSVLTMNPPVVDDCASAIRRCCAWTEVR